ncbi:MAG TPA: ABC-F family ATP-binding cassette domain-containing protein [Jiangellaceae bacterium]|nr:ABC-F family ATP-binding cassette domain-containing protein [Jiangellaceae bacterium]
MAVNLVNLESVGLAHGTRQILRDVSLGIARGDRIGVVGRNGSGKTTLLHVLARCQPVDQGRVTHTGGLRVGMLGQDDDLPAEQTARAVVLGSRAEHEWAGDARTREVLANLLAAVPLDAFIGQLSGGEQRRIALAQLLIRSDDLLLLDEPTNHLDVEAIDWLARHLSSSNRSVVLVSHDRWLLDAVCDTLWEVVDGDVRSYDGGYSEFVLSRAERERIAAVSAARRTNLIRKELAWLRRGPPARTSKPKFRIEAANALIADEPPPRDHYELARFATARLGKGVYDLEDLTMGYGGRPLLDRVTWRLGPGDRVGVVGVNGSGKTTLLRLLAGEMGPDAGKVRVGRTVVPAYLSQEVTELDPEDSVLGVVEDVRRVTTVGRRELTARQLLEQFGFSGPALWTPVAELSGGERRRLQLLRLLMAEPNVLLLDEPTNDLDIETLTVLEDLLDGWPGTVVVVSHDRWFLERTTDAIWALLGDGSLVHLPGGVEEYLARRRAVVAATGDAAVSQGVAGGAASRRRVGDTRTARKELARIERDVDKLAHREEHLHEELAEHATDPERVLELDGALRELQADRKALEARWMELAEQLD